MTAADLRRTRWDIVGFAVAAGILVAFQIGKMPAALPQLSRELGLTPVEAGWAISLISAVTCVLGIAAGAISDLVGARRFIIGGIVVTAMASIAGGFADSGAMFLATRLIEGLGALTVFVAGPVIVLRAIDAKDQRVALSLWSAYMPAGTSLMVLISPALLAFHGWRGIWWFAAGLLLAFAIVFAVKTRAVADPPIQPDRRFARLRGDIGQVVCAPGPWLLALCFLTYTSNFLAVTSFLPTFLTEVEGYDLGWAAALTALVVAGNVFGNVCGGWLLHKGAKRWALIAIASFVMGSTALLIYRPSTPEAIRVALGFAFTFVGGFLPASIIGGVPVHAPAPALIGTTNGLIMQCTNIGMLLTPPVFAAIAARHGWSAAPLLTAAFSALGIGLALMIGRHEARQARV